MTIALATGWPPDQVARLTLPEVDHVRQQLEARNG